MNDNTINILLINFNIFNPGYFDTGDRIEKIEQFDKSQIPKAYRDAINEVGDVPIEIQNLFTYEFLNRSKNTDDYRLEKIVEISNTTIGLESLAGKIVNNTFKIRKGRQLLREQPNNVGLKILVNRWNTKRLKYLIELKKFDAIEYDKLLDKLEIDKPTLVMGEKKANRIERKKELRRLTKEYCDKIIEKRMNDYHIKLKEQQKILEKDKKEFEEWLSKKVNELKIDESLIQI